jgi:hypothetical protein
VSFYDIEQDGTDAGGVRRHVHRRVEGRPGRRKNGKIVSPRCPTPAVPDLQHDAVPQGVPRREVGQGRHQSGGVGEFEKATIKPRPKG